MLQPGDKSPLFCGVNQHGKNICLKDFKHQKVALYFYPKDGTPTCTVQACNLRDHYPALKKKGFEVIGVSTDTIQQHEKFSSKHALPFSLIADTDLKIVQAYGVWAEKQLFGKKYMGIVRTTFIIERGIIREILRKPVSKAHAEEIMQIKS